MFRKDKEKKKVRFLIFRIPHCDIFNKVINIVRIALEKSRFSLKITALRA